MPRDLVVLWLFLLTAASLPGQDISGHVRDSLGEGVPFASVVATNCQGEQVLTFITTDEYGFYRLTIITDCDSILLTARCLGYRPTNLWISARSLPLVQDFVLIANGMALREVVVRDKASPVVIRSDTTEYNTASFSDSTEFSVEDLLRKLPGVRISEQGLVTYNGKIVERMLIEGDDLFSQNYALATRNIRADVISKVQVVDRFQENPLLRGIQESDRLVMNLKIKLDRKRSLSGSALGGLGYGEEWKGRAHTNLFSLSRKDKLYVIGNANNSGENEIGEVEGLSQGDILDPNRQSLQNNPLRVRSVWQAPMPVSVGLPAAYSQSNSSGLLFVGQVLPISPYFKTKISAWLGREQVRQTLDYFTRYQLDSGRLEISENRVLRLDRSIHNLQIETEYYASNKKHSLRSFVKITGRKQRSDLRLLRSQTGSGDSPIEQLTEDSPFDGYGSLEYTFKTGKSTVFQLVNKNAWYRNHAFLRPQYARYSLFFGLDSTFTQLEQTALQREGESVVTGRWLAHRYGVQWLAEAGADWHWARLDSKMQMEDAHGEMWAPTNGAYRNAIRLAAPRYFIHISATRTWGPLLLRAHWNQDYLPTRLTTSGLTRSASLRWTVAPRLDLRYTAGDKSVFTGFYGFRQERPDFIDLHPGLLFTDYQSVVRGLPDLAFIPTHQAGLNYIFNDRRRQFSWNVGGRLQSADNKFGDSYQVNPYWSVLEKFRPVRTHLYAMNGSIHHFFSKINVRLELGAGLTALQETARINSDQLRDLYRRQYTFHFGSGTAFNTWVNVICSSRLAYSIVRQSDAAAAAPFQAAIWFSTAQILVRPSKKFDFKLYLHRIAHSGALPSQDSYAADCTGQLHLRRWHSDLGLTAFNLLGSRSFGQSVTDSFFQHTTRVIAVQRFFLVSWNRQF